MCSVAVRCCDLQPFLCRNTQKDGRYCHLTWTWTRICGFRKWTNELKDIWKLDLIWCLKINPQYQPEPQSVAAAVWVCWLQTAGISSIWPSVRAVWESFPWMKNLKVTSFRINKPTHLSICVIQEMKNKPWSLCADLKTWSGFFLVSWQCQCSSRLQVAPSSAAGVHITSPFLYHVHYLSLLLNLKMLSWCFLCSRWRQHINKTLLWVILELADHLFRGTLWGFNHSHSLF